MIWVSIAQWFLNSSNTKLQVWCVWPRVHRRSFMYSWWDILCALISTAALCTGYAFNDACNKFVPIHQPMLQWCSVMWPHLLASCTEQESLLSTWGRTSWSAGCPTHQPTQGPLSPPPRHGMGPEQEAPSVCLHQSAEQSSSPHLVSHCCPLLVALGPLPAGGPLAPWMWSQGSLHSLSNLAQWVHSEHSTVGCSCTHAPTPTPTPTHTRTHTHTHTHKHTHTNTHTHTHTHTLDHTHTHTPT